MMAIAKRCPSCGGMLLPGAYGTKQLICHNDYCELNRDGLRKREMAESVGTGVRLGCFVIQLAVVCAIFVGAGYGLYLLLGG